MQSDTRSPADLAEVEAMLRSRREELLRQAASTIADDMVVSVDERPDELDQASSDTLQAFTFRLRTREQRLLVKIEDALDRFRRGTYGTCEECDEPIGVARLRARPEATMCIVCKETQEHQEHQFAG